MMSVTNAALLKLSRRAEANPRNLLETFVDIGPLFGLLSSHDHQVIFGRRGTGKTHALSYLASDRELRGDAVAMVDLRKVGSSGGLYGDPSRTLQERATGLIVDVLTAVHDALLQYFVAASDSLDLSAASRALDAMADAITQVTVVGETEIAAKTSRAVDRSSSDHFGLGAGAKLGVSVKMSRSVEISSSGSETIRKSGHERLHVNFGSTTGAFQQIVDVMDGRRLWLLLDEWSCIPLALQPYLADLLRRSVFPITGVTVKIAAIEQRAHFRAQVDGVDYVGIELGADASADVCLDDFMVFDNDQGRASTFLRNLVARHVGVRPEDTEQFVEYAFEPDAFPELVQAAEGVPRDAINLLVLAAQRAVDKRISADHIRTVAKAWYQRDKEKAVSSNAAAFRMLHWIVEEVVGRLRTRAFVLASGTKDGLIDALFDARVVHVIKRGASPHDRLGEQFDVYKVDYGSYCELLPTSHAPLGLCRFADPARTDVRHVEMVPDDYSSMRLELLSLEQFYGSSGGAPLPQAEIM